MQSIQSFTLTYKSLFSFTISDISITPETHIMCQVTHLHSLLFATIWPWFCLNAYPTELAWHVYLGNH